jgi:hypothetical protein
LKKRSKKLLFFRDAHDRGYGPDRSASAGIEVFLLLFLQKKKNPFCSYEHPEVY